MPAKDDHDNLISIAGRLFGDAADDAAEFVRDGMRRLGYRERIEWDDPEPSGGNGNQGGGDFFDRQRQRQQRPPAGSGGNGSGGQDTRRVGGGRGGGEYAG